jgi:hypothetical protein
MQYINPYGLLNLSSNSLSDINSLSIRKARTALFIQIDLTVSESNNIGYIEYKGIHLTRTDCIKIIDELDSNNKREFHFFIYQNKPLNDFLTNGNISFFNNYKIESIYNLPEFIDFISPYFSDQYNKLLFMYFQKWDIINSTKILSISLLVNAQYHDKCYTKVRLFLRGIMDEIKNLRVKIEQDNGIINSASYNHIFYLITKSISTTLINLLPDAQFQTIRNALGDSIHYLGIIVHNIEYKKSDNDITKNLSHCFYITEVAKEIDCTGLEEKEIRKSYFIQKDHYESLQATFELQKKKPILNKYAQLKESILAKIEEIDNKTTTPALVNTWISNSINSTEINLLDNTFIKTKNEIALLLKSLSLSVWNNQDEIDSALFILSKGREINADEITKSKLLNAKIQLDDLKLKIERQREANKQRLSSYKPKEKSSYSLLIGIGVIILIIYLISNSNNSRNSRNSYLNNNYSTPSPTVDSTSTYANSSPPLNNSNSSDNSNLLEPIYTKVVVINGNFSNCSGVKPKYDKSISTKLIISTELTDIALKIFDYSTDNCIRFVFINSGTTYTVKNIPEGNYYLKIAYGNDWSVKQGESICKGHFLSHATYKKDNNLYDFNKIYKGDGRVSIPYYTLRLYRTFTTDNTEDNSAGNSISETDFNN